MHGRKNIKKSIQILSYYKFWIITNFELLQILSYYKFWVTKNSLSAEIFFTLKYLFFRPLDSAAPGGGCTTCPLPSSALCPCLEYGGCSLFRIVTSASVFVVPEAFYVAEKARGNWGGETSFVVGWAVICVTVGTFKASRQLRNMSALVGIWNRVVQPVVV